MNIQRRGQNGTTPTITPTTTRIDGTIYDTVYFVLDELIKRACKDLRNNGARRWRASDYATEGADLLCQFMEETFVPVLDMLEDLEGEAA